MGEMDPIWVCSNCSLPLETTKAQMRYVGSVFTIDVPMCPQCGVVLITEEMAVNKMAEAEQLLEDK